MKKSLQDIFDERKSLVSTAKKLGLINLRIYRTAGRKDLNLFVELDPENPEASFTRINLFADYLVDKYKCQLKVTDTLEPSDFREDISKNPPRLVSIEDLLGIQSLFNNQSLDKIEFEPIQIHEEDALMYESQTSTSVRLVEDIIRKWNERHFQSVVSPAGSKISSESQIGQSVNIPESDENERLRKEAQQALQRLLPSQSKQKQVSSSMWSSPKISGKRKITTLLEAIVDTLYDYVQREEQLEGEWFVTVLDTQKERLSKKRRTKETP